MKKSNSRLTDEDESSLLPGEKKTLQLPDTVSVFHRGTRSRRAGAEECTLSLTNFRILLVEKQKDESGRQVSCALFDTH